MTDLERVILRLQRDLAWAAISQNERAEFWTVWLRDNPEPVMKEMDEPQEA